jgi:serine protease Do
MPTSRALSLTPLVLLLATPLFAAGEREEKVRKDKAQIEADDYWIYNDLPRGIAEAKKSGKPLLIVFRCLPCEACAKFDEQVVRRDPAVKELMDRFVPVRIVHANGMDLTQFHFDFDQSFAAFLMNGDGTIYGRFGTKSQREDEAQDMTMGGFAKTLAAGFDLHARYPQVKASLAGKKGGDPLPVKQPEQFATLKGKYDDRIHYEGDVVQSCIHCHQIRESERRHYRDAGKPIPERSLFAFPMPDTLGLTMDATQAARIKEVAKGSTAEQDGFRAGDELVALKGQPIISIADVQWVLHNAGEDGFLTAEVRRGGKPMSVRLTLDKGWRQRQPISFRATTWDLRRMVSGGLVLEDLTDEERAARKLSMDALALRVKYVGQYNEHAQGKNAGFQKDDVIVEAGDRTGRMSETDYIAWALRDAPKGSTLVFKVLRGGKTHDLTLTMR